MRKVKSFLPSPKMSKTGYGPKVKKTGTSPQNPAGIAQAGIGTSGPMLPAPKADSTVPPHISLEQLINANKPKPPMGLRSRPVPAFKEQGINPKRNASA